MAEHSINDFTYNLNLQILPQDFDTLCASLVKAQALLMMALHCNLQDYPISMMHDYLWVLDDLIDGAKSTCDNMKML